MSIEDGSIVKGTVVKVADFGAIVSLEGGNTGLIHISEISNTYVRDVRDYLCENDVVTVKVLRKNPKGRYDLSVKRCTPQESTPTPEPSRPARAAVTGQDPTRPTTFEDKLSRFMKDSEEKQHDLKRHLETKRGRK